MILLCLAFVCVVLAALITRVLYQFAVHRRLINKVLSIVDHHKAQLVRRQLQLVRHDPYGKPILDNWYKEIDYFITAHVHPSLSISQQSALEKTRREISELIAARVETFNRQIPPVRTIDAQMTGIDFEIFCAEQLRSQGWLTQVTQASGDQGIDIVANKKGLHIALQCKLYSGSVGNDAVQQVVAGKAFVRADFCAVVTNSRYTSSAQQLAAANNVLLLHYKELPLLESLLTGEISSAKISDDAASPEQTERTPELTHPTLVDADTNERPAIDLAWRQQNSLKLVGIIILILSIAIVAGMYLRRGRSSWSRIHDDIPSAYTTYVNNRFGYKLEYPNSFVFRSNAANGDGITVASPDGSAILTVAGANNDFGMATSEYYQKALHAISGHLGYNRLEHSWFVVTWAYANRVAYQKMFVGQGCQVSFTFTYPDNQHSLYDPVVAKIEKSFKHGPLNQAR